MNQAFMYSLTEASGVLHMFKSEHFYKMNTIKTDILILYNSF